jgi:hypothetical protein
LWGFLIGSQRQFEEENLELFIANDLFVISINEEIDEKSKSQLV